MCVCVRGIYVCIVRGTHVCLWRDTYKCMWKGTHVCMCKRYAHMCMSEGYIYVYVRARGWCWVSSSITPHLLHWPLPHGPVCSRDSPVPISALLRLWVLTTALGLLCKCCGSELRSSCFRGTLPTEPSPWLQVWSFTGRGMRKGGRRKWANRYSSCRENT